MLETVEPRRISNRDTQESFSVASIKELCGAEWTSADMTALAMHASDRRFFRLKLGAKSLIIIDASREQQKISAYIKVAAALRAHSISAPDVYNVDHTAGLMAVEDMGDQLLGPLATGKSSKRDWYYRIVLSLLLQMQTMRDPDCAEHYTIGHLLTELEIFLDWHCQGSRMLDKQERTYFLEEWTKVLTEIAQTESAFRVFVHKDLHLDNLTWMGDRRGYRRVGVLDFQDAKFGSPAYDLVSVAEDMRYPLAESEKKQFLESAVCDARADLRESILESYPVYAAQRAFKILGNIHYLARQRGKGQFLAYDGRLRTQLEGLFSENRLKNIGAFVAEKGLFRRD